MDGILYSAAGETCVAEAVASARSSLLHNSVPHLLFASPVPENASGVDGLSIEPFEPSDNPYVDKIANMRRSPYERTLYLDTDTFVTGELAHVFELLDTYDLAATYARGYRGLLDPEMPLAFREFNTGVIAWRAGDRTAAFMEAWQETYVAWLRSPPFPGAGSPRGKADQPAFRRCAWEHRLRIMVLPPEYNWRTNKPGMAVGQVLVVHGRHADYPRIAAQVNESEKPRSIPALPERGPALSRRPTQ